MYGIILLIYTYSVDLELYIQQRNNVTQLAAIMSRLCTGNV